MKAVYTIGILDFVFDEDKNDQEYYHHVVKLMDVNTKEDFYDKLTYIYLEMPKFQKTEDELETIADKWLYALKNQPRLLERPKAQSVRQTSRRLEMSCLSRCWPMKTSFCMRSPYCSSQSRRRPGLRSMKSSSSFLGMVAYH